MSSDDTPITREQAARLLGTSERHVRRLIQQGRLETHPDERGTQRLRHSTVQRYAAASQDAVTQLEAGALLGVGRRTIRRMLDDGRLQAAPNSGGHDRVTRASVHARLTDGPTAPVITGHNPATRGHAADRDLVDILSAPDVRPEEPADTVEADATRANADPDTLVALLDLPPSDPPGRSSELDSHFETFEAPPEHDADWPASATTSQSARTPTWASSIRVQASVVLVAVALLGGALLALRGTGAADSNGHPASRPSTARQLPTTVRAHRLHPSLPVARTTTHPRARGGRARAVTRSVLLTRPRAQPPTLTAPAVKPANPGRTPNVTPAITTNPQRTDCGLFASNGGLC